jgi:flagellar biosynthesis protein FlhB
MANDDQGEKTEQATPHKLEEARKKGQVVTSKDLAAAVSLTAAVISGYMAAPQVIEGTVSIGRWAFSQGQGSSTTPADVQAQLVRMMEAVLPGVAAIIGAAAVAGGIAGLVVTRFNFAPEALVPKPERLDPFANLKSNFFSATPWVNLAKSLAVGGLLAWAVYAACVTWLPYLPGMASWAPAVQLFFIGSVTGSIFERSLPIVLLIGVVDLLWQHYKTSNDLMMTRQELKQEMKDTEGDPMLKQRRRARGRQIAFSKQLKDTETADVVVTNPTHFAAALRYRREVHVAPILVARGADLAALKIRAVAVRHDIPIVENRALARALVAKGRVGAPIPADYYGPVAKILAALLRRRNSPKGVR